VIRFFKHLPDPKLAFWFQVCATSGGILPSLAPEAGGYVIDMF